MADALKLGPLGQVSLQIREVAEAEHFYKDVLGLAHLFTFGDLAFFDCDGVRLFLSASEERTEGAGSSVLYFQVPEIKSASEELRRLGVAFEAEPHLIHRHENGVEEWMAFFRDPSGNRLPLMSQVESAD